MDSNVIRMAKISCAKQHSSVVCRRRIALATWKSRSSQQWTGLSVVWPSKFGCPAPMPRQKKTIEACASIRNEQLRKHGFSPVQWFSRSWTQTCWIACWCRWTAESCLSIPGLGWPYLFCKAPSQRDRCEAFLEEHARDTWRRAVGGRNRPTRGPYTQGQMVYMYRSQGRVFHIEAWRCIAVLQAQWIKVKMA